MTNKLVTLFTRSPMHVGGGSSVGAIDQTLVRERHTRFPVIPGSGLKGVLADLWLEKNPKWSEETKDIEKKKIRSNTGIDIFGTENASDDKAKAGRVLIGEGKLLAFPIRSAKGCFAWVTCPIVLTRFARDTGKVLTIPTVAETSAYASDELKLGTKVIFEEYPLEFAGNVGEDIRAAFTSLCDDQVWKDEVASKLAIVSDDIFTYFAENACEVATHIKVNDDTGVVKDGALFNQENVPSETLFYSLFSFKEDEDIGKVENKLNEENNLIQIGANATTGLGWVSVAMKEVK